MEETRFRLFPSATVALVCTHENALIPHAIAQVKSVLDSMARGRDDHWNVVFELAPHRSSALQLHARRTKSAGPKHSSRGVAITTDPTCDVACDLADRPQSGGGAIHPFTATSNQKPGTRPPTAGGKADLRPPSAIRPLSAMRGSDLRPPSARGASMRGPLPVLGFNMSTGKGEMMSFADATDDVRTA